MWGRWRCLKIGRGWRPGHSGVGYMQGESQKSRAASEQLFAYWKNADPDNPVLVRARQEDSVHRGGH
jgi:hypothetical protein